MIKNKKTVAFIFKNEFTTSHLSRNVSQFFYNKLELNVNMSTPGQIKTALKKADFVFIDYIDETIKHVNVKKTKLIYVPSNIFCFKKLGLNNSDLTDKQIKKLTKLYNNISYVLSSSDIHTQVLKDTYNLKDDQIIKLGVSLIDELNSTNLSNDTEKLMQRYPETLTGYSVLYIPSKRDNLADNQKQIDIINELSNKYDNISLFYYLDDEVLKHFKKQEIKGTLIDVEDINPFLNITNFTITDFSDYILSGIYLNRNIISYNYDNTSLTYDLSKLPIYNVDSVDEIINILDTKLETKLDNQMCLSQFITYNNSAISRKVIVKLLGKQNA